MAPSPDRAYFPPLEDCLGGDEVLVCVPPSQPPLPSHKLLQPSQTVTN